jgi:hypothetical protein
MTRQLRPTVAQQIGLVLLLTIVALVALFGPT